MEEKVKFNFPNFGGRWYRPEDKFFRTILSKNKKQEIYPESGRESLSKCLNKATEKKNNFNSIVVTKEDIGINKNKDFTYLIIK